jgi:UDP-3-O-[3-hydroxymyristoyl] glucosamine N-acyltransferase
MKLKQLAKLVPGSAIAGDQEVIIKNVSPLEDARPGDLVFVLDNKKLDLAQSSKASALVVQTKTKVKNKPCLLVDNPRNALAYILPQFTPRAPLTEGIHKTAVIPKSCKLGKKISIGPYVVLGEKAVIGDNTKIISQVYIGNNVVIGADCVIYPHVTIYDGTKVGNRVILHSGTRIGIDGYGFIQEQGKHKKIPQIGKVIIEDEVELFANVCVSRATLGATIIGQGTKIDNLTHVAHNCKIGKHCAVVSLVGFAGSVTLKDHVTVAGQAGFNGHINIGENTIIMARSGVTKDIPANSVVSGFPAQDHRQEIAYQATLRQLAKKAK